MGVFHQTALLLWKNMLLRLRSPGTFAMEVLWPVIIVGIVSILRTGAPPSKALDCHYQSRDMPSSGAVPFLQSLICNSDNKCYESEAALNVIKQRSQRFARLTHDLAPYFGSKELLDMLTASSKYVKPASKIIKFLGEKDILHNLEQVLNISRYFRDPEKVKEILIKDYEFPTTVGDDLLGSKINAAKLINIRDTSDFKTTVCDQSKLVSYVKFPAGSDSEMASRTLCALNDSDTSDLIFQIIKQLNITTVFDTFWLFEKMKERFGSSSPSSLAFGSIVEVFETTTSAKSIIKYLGDFSAIPNVADFIKRAPKLIKGFLEFSSALDVIEDIVFGLEPLMVNFGLDNSTVWRVVSDTVKLNVHYKTLLDNQWNGTTEELLQPVDVWLQNIKLLLQENNTRYAVAVLNFLTKIDWLGIYNQIRTTKTLNRETVKLILEPLQEMLNHLPGWSTVQKVAKIVEHIFDIISLVTEKSRELKHEFRKLLEDNINIQNELNQLFQYGPVISKTLLESFTSSEVLADILSTENLYKSICERVMPEIEPKVTADMYQNIFSTICTGKVKDELNVIIEKMKLSEVKNLITAVVHQTELLCNDDIHAQSVMCNDIYGHYDHLAAAIDIYTQDNYTWTQLFHNITFSSMDLNETFREPFIDVLKIDFFSHGLPWLYRSLGQALAGSSVSEELPPYVYVLNQLSKIMYNNSSNFTVSFPRNSIITMAVKFITNYTSDIVNGIYYFWHYDMDAATRVKRDVHTAINWTQFAYKIIASIEQFLSLNFHGGFDFSLLRILSINMSRDEFYKISKTLGTMNLEKLISICNSLNNSLSNTENDLIVPRVIAALNLITNLTKVLPELDELACTFVMEAGFDFIGMMKKLKSTGLWSNVIKAVIQFISPAEIVSCTNLLQANIILLKAVNVTVLSNDLNIDLMTQCLSRANWNPEEVLTSFTQTASFIRDVLTVLQTPELQKLLSSQITFTVLNFITDIARSNRAAIIHIADLLQDTMKATDYLVNILGLPQSVVYSFLNATVHKNGAYFLTKFTELVADIVCDPDKLSDTIDLPDSSAVSITEMSFMICTSEIINTISFLKNISISAETIAKMMSIQETKITDVIENITTVLADVIFKFKDFFILAAKYMIEFDVNVLKDNTDIIDSIIQSHALTELAHSLGQLIDAAAMFIPAGSENDITIKDVRQILKAAVSLDMLKDFVLEEVQVKDLVKNPEQLMWYLTSTLEFSDDVMQKIMDAVFSSQMFLGVLDHPPYTCEEVLKMIIIMNSSKTSVENVRDALCALNEVSLRGLAKQLISELNIGSLVAKYVANTGHAVLKALNLTAEDLNDMFQKMYRGLETLNETSEIIRKSSLGTVILNSFGSEETNVFLSLDRLAPFFCGESKVDLFDINFSPGLVIGTPDDIKNDLNGGITDGDLDLPNEFCIKMYEQIKRTGIGSALWSYLKPVMRGKILFTPDNPVTRKIVSKANNFFDLLNEVRRVTKIWAEETLNLMAVADAFSGIEDLKDALENDFIRDILEAQIQNKLQTIKSIIDALQTSNLNINHLNALQKIGEIVENYSQCIVTDRFQPVNSESELEQEAYRLSHSKNFFAGIVFMNVGEHDNKTSFDDHRQKQTLSDVPAHIGYKIRMDVDNVMDTLQLRSSLWKMSREDNVVEDMRYLRGFIYLQDLIDSSIIKIHKDQELLTPGFKIKQMPFPCHHEDNFIFFLGAYLIPVMMTFAFLASLGVATRNLVYDRENGQEENIHVMGMISGLNFISWLISTMTIMTVVSFILAVMLKYTNVFIYSNYFIIFLYIVEFCFSSVMLLYMVSAFFVRTSMAILFVLMVYLISYLPYTLMTGLEVSAKFWHKILACLASTTAFSFGALRLAYLEEGGIGIQWENLTEASSEDAGFSWMCFMMLIDSAGYFLVGWYIRSVKPGKYGVPQPWYFPVTHTFWCSCFRAKKSVNFDFIQISDAAGEMSELPPEDQKVGIAVFNLSKIYSNKKKAVENLTVNFYQDQVTTLLGCNGAAKTTTMKMICGVLEPTSGSILMNGQEAKMYQNSLGVCPQQNALFLYMTVYEHMKFYAGIKGASNSEETQIEIKKLLKDVDLWNVKNVLVRNVSYGMKRRLCVALAFVGGSKTVILDEPTSGVDPHARKNIWNIITRNKLGHTIILTTHHLDEADFLSDRIAVMHQGKLLCCGSPAFLKKTFGGGFSLTVVKKEHTSDHHDENHELTHSSAEGANTTVLDYIHSVCPGASVVEHVGTDITFKIPKDLSRQMIPVYEIFRHLDQFSEQLGIASYGVSDTTLEEVFLKLIQAADTVSSSNNLKLPVTFHDEAESFDMQNMNDSVFKPQPETVHAHDRRKGAALIFSQIGALLLKRCHHYHRNWRIFTSVLILPMISLLISMGFSVIRTDEGNMKQLVLDPHIYGPQTHIFFQNSGKNEMASLFVKTLLNSSLGIGTSCMNDWVMDYFHNNSCVLESSWYNITSPFVMVGCQNSRQVYTEMAEMFSVPEKIISSSMFIQNLEGQVISSYLLKTFKNYKENRYGGWSFEEKSDSVHPYVWFNSKGYHAMPSFFNSLSNIVLRSQLPSSKEAAEYGITTINHPLKLGRAALTVKSLQGDAADAGISLVIVIAFSFIPCGFMLYVINERIQKERQLQNISGVHFFIYWSVAFVWDMFMYATTVGVAVIIVVIFKTDSYYVRSNLAAFAAITLLYGWAVIPCLYCVTRFFSNGSTAYLVTFCASLFIAFITIASLLVLQLFRDSYTAFETYKVLKYLYLIFPQYALGQGLLNMAGNTVKYKLFMRFGEDRYDNPFSADVIGWHLIALGCEGLFYFVLTLLQDGINGPSISISYTTSQHEVIVDDEDVLREQERIHQSSRNDLLVVDNLSKVYRRGWKKFQAVNHISFGVAEGESFGLLGVNGAGKTTTFRMLTGDSTPSGGAVFLKGRKMSPNDRYFEQDVGYCPQERGLDEYLTGEEVLSFHSQFRGFNAEQTKAIVNDLLSRLALTQYAKRTVHTYSGGTKRKLALAVALLGDPSVLYLDEPTAGMDAATRRLAWKCIEQAKRNGQSVVLTSHSMDECDVLCSRIAIMVKGQIKCIGSPQHLKNKFCQGYTVLMHASNSHLNELISSFLNKFPSAVIKAKHYSSVEMRVPQTAGSVADILVFLQEKSVIDYYSLSQTTLDSVFISFAQEQMDIYEDDESSGSSTSSKTVSAAESLSSFTQHCSV